MSMARTAADVIADVISLREARVSSYRKRMGRRYSFPIPNFARRRGVRHEAPHRPLSNLGYTFFSLKQLTPSLNKSADLVIGTI